MIRCDVTASSLLSLIAMLPFLVSHAFQFMHPSFSLKSSLTNSITNCRVPPYPKRLSSLPLFSLSLSFSLLGPEAESALE